MDTKARAIASAYEKWVLMEYEFWTLLLHTDQYYLGRAYAWQVREGKMQDFGDLWAGELTELQAIVKEYRSVLGKLWKPSIMNYAWLGNMIGEHGGHGHLHIIPRYDSSRLFKGVEFSDEQWGRNYSPYAKREYPESLLRDIARTVGNGLSE